MPNMHATIKSFVQQFKYEPAVNGRLQLDGIKYLIILRFTTASATLCGKGGSLK